MVTIENKLLVIAGIGILLIILATFIPFAPTEIISENDIVATVNEEDITEAELQAEIEKLPAYYLSGGVDDKTLRKAVLEQLIARKLLIEEVKKLGIIVFPEEIKEAITNITIQAELTEEEFENKIKEQNLSLEEFEDILKEQIAINKVIQQNVLADIKITEEDILEYYNQEKDNMKEVQASHILICYEGAMRCQKTRTKEEAYTEISGIIQQLKEGADFNETAKNYSDDPSAKINNGELGWFKKGEMVPEFEDAAFQMNVGEFSEEPVETDFGYHIILVTGKREGYEDFKDDILELLTLQKQRSEIEEYIKELKENATVKYFLE